MNNDNKKNKCKSKSKNKDKDVEKDKHQIYNKCVHAHSDPSHQKPSEIHGPKLITYMGVS